jgi:hypothetical protein
VVYPPLKGIATVKALSGGSFLISDDLGQVSSRRRKIAQALLPVTGRTAVALDLLDKEMPEVRLHVCVCIFGWICHG